MRNELKENRFVKSVLIVERKKKHLTINFLS